MLPKEIKSEALVFGVSIHGAARGRRTSWNAVSLARPPYSSGKASSPTSSSSLCCSSASVTITI